MTTLTVVERERLEHATHAHGSIGWHAEVEAIIAEHETAARALVADRIAGELNRKVCTDTCEHHTCVTYRHAAVIARRHGTTTTHIPTQQGAPA